MERRSSVRVRSLLPGGFRKISRSQMDELEARILDSAVLAAERAVQEEGWEKRLEDLPRESQLVLRELRALRQQVAGLQNLVEHKGDELEEHWLVLNDRGVFIEGVLDWDVGDLCEFQIRIPSVEYANVVGLGEVVRVGTGEESGVAIVFRLISEAHSRAITRYAMLRERQGARSVRYS